MSRASWGSRGRCWGEALGNAAGRGCRDWVEAHLGQGELTNRVTNWTNTKPTVLAQVKVGVILGYGYVYGQS